MPLIQNWKGSANYTFDWSFLFPESGLATLEVNDTSFKCDISISKGSRGMWVPKLHMVNLNLGKTKLDVEDLFWNWILNQAFVLGKVLFENSFDIFGTTMVSASSGAIIEQMTTGFELTVPLEIKPLQKSDNF